MEEEHILLSFKGVVTSDLLTSVLQIMESKMTYLDESPKTKKKVFNVLVECLQNLYHHIDVEPDSQSDVHLIEAKSALFVIARDEDGFHIRTGNYIPNEQRKPLQERLDIINGMEKEELKIYYQAVLNEGQVSEKGTAGLGLIDIARKSGNKLEYEIIQTDPNTAFFCLSVKIN